MPVDIKGNTEGVKKSCLDEIYALAELAAVGRSFASAELCSAMLGFTHKYNRELAVYLDSRGKVIEASLGDFQTVRISSFNDSSRIRCIHTHPKGIAELSLADITAAESEGFAAMACIALGDNAEFAGASILLAGESEPLYFRHSEEFCSFEMPSLSRRETVEENESKALLISLSCGRKLDSVIASLEELAELAVTAGVRIAGIYKQNAQKPIAATYIGRGKVSEMRMEAQLKGADTLIFDDEISPTQLYNLEQLTGLRVIDRTMLILDIFAARAQSNEGKLQVELAQLRYMLPRLVGRGTQLSRLGGGIGTRGPGETKLETDKRKIHLRIRDLEQRLSVVERERNTRRNERIDKELPSVALVGYTNAGKSTLLNALSGAESFSADLLFATLDTLTRRIEPASGRPFLLSDTVGFIRRLPHQLIAAFRATLDELRYADILLHVMDISSSEAIEQAEAVESVLKELNLESKPVITVFNKCDRDCPDRELLAAMYPQAVCVSALTGEGFEVLLNAISNTLAGKRGYCRYRVNIPYSSSSVLPLIHDNAEIISTEYTELGTCMEIESEPVLHDRLVKMGFDIEEV